MVSWSLVFEVEPAHAFDTLDVKGLVRGGRGGVHRGNLGRLRVQETSPRQEGWR